MEITILRSGGNTPIPMPTCDCKVCVEAREKGEPYARRGNSTFIHDENILIDTPEQVWYSLNRENIEQLDYIFISHFHYDHILGLRVLQPLGIEDHPIDEWFEDIPTLVMSQATYNKIRQNDSILGHIIDKWADVKILNDGEEFQVGEITVTSIGLEIHPGEGKVISSYLLEKNGKKVMISQDENKILDTSIIPKLDLWIRETGKFEETAGGEPIMTEERWEDDQELEISFQETVEQIKEVEPRKAVLTEIEELFRYSYDDLNELEENYEDLNLKFAYDGMKLEV
jgi:phosphoribosyl 1,2-cyclic phosphate phosphodiesterase